MADLLPAPLAALSSGGHASCPRLSKQVGKAGLSLGETGPEGCPLEPVQGAAEAASCPGCLKEAHGATAPALRPNVMDGFQGLWAPLSKTPFPELG